MFKMSSQIETIVNAYKTLSKVPTIVGGTLNNTGKKITSTQSIRNIDKGKSTKYVYNYALDEELNVISKSDFGMDITNVLLSTVSPKETFKALIREEKDSKDVKKQYLEIWKFNGALTNCIDLTALDIHGDVYADSEFGSLDWSQDESAVIYIAERKLKKSEPYIKRNKPEDASKTGSGDTAIKGEEYVYKQDWGEQLVGKHLSVIVLCKIQTESFTILEGLPESCCPGQVRFSPDGLSVVGTAWETEPVRLGLIFCTNRPSFIFQLTLDGKLQKLSAAGMAVRSPRFRPNGDLVWLQRAADGPHHACHELVLKRRGQSKVTTIVDIVQTSVPTLQGDPFYGIYSQALIKNCFSKDGGRIIFSTPGQFQVKSYAVDIESGNISEFPSLASGSLTILDVKNDVILASWSNMNSPAQLYVGKLPAGGKESEVKWTRVSDPVEVPAEVAKSTVQYLTHRHEDTDDAVKTFTSLYFAPASDKQLPLIVSPHGGPHSGFVDSFSLEAALYSILGFATLLINYRGSIGAGEKSVNFLPKLVGDADVKDCKLATEDALKRFRIDEKKVCLVGGSHGGFLVAHLSGQYPDTYKAVASRNPVIDVASMYNSSDIPDCPRFSLGFATLRVNYRGSTGSGDSNLRCLLSNAGSFDVADCRLALTDACERDARVQSISLYGGSYGGFVVTHLAGQFPERFRSVVTRNPLIDLATKGHYADNIDGCLYEYAHNHRCAVEAGFPFNDQGPPSEDELLAMRRCSPIVHAHKVKAPTALMLGTGDKRVPRYQGLEYARRLKANGVKTRIYMYDDNHSLSSLPHEMDHVINGASWFLEHLE